jgi:putative transcriptional regulator
MHRIYLLIVAALLAPAAGAQTPTAGRLLVATPELHDSSLARSIVLLLDYGTSGASGVLINRPTWVTPAAAFPELDYLDEYSGHVYFGGPVAHGTLSALYRASRPTVAGLERVINNVYLGTDFETLREIAAAVADEQELRLYAGLASWAPGQLEREIRRGLWRVLPGDAELVFSREPLELWERLSRAEPEFVVDAPRPAAAVAAGR